MTYVVEPLPLDDLPRRLFVCTPTRLTTWLDCPRRYRMTYLDRPSPQRGPPWAHNSVGASVHTALASWWRLRLRDRTVRRAGDLLERGFLTDGFRDDAQLALHRGRARAMVESYVARLDPEDEPIGVERTVSIRTETLAASGRVDRLDLRPTGDGAEHDAELVVVDYKSGRRVLDVDDARSSLPLALYALAASRTLRRTCRRVELHHLPTGRVLRWEHTDESLAGELRRAEHAGAEARDASETPDDDARFPPRPGAHCGWCDYQRLCPEGRSAAPSRRPWDGLDS